MIKEELQRDIIREKAGKRAWGFENKMEEGRGSELARRCWKEIREEGKVGKGEKGWKEEKRFFEDRGTKLEEKKL